MAHSILSRSAAAPASTSCRCSRDHAGLSAAANLDCLFETGLIAFDDDGRILISPELDTAARDALGLSPDLRLAVVPTLGQRGYLAKHRERTRAMREASA